MTLASRRHALRMVAGAALASVAAGLVRSASLEKVREKGVLRVAVYADLRLFSWREGSKVLGIDADLGRALAEALGVRVDLWDFVADEEVGDDLRNTVWRGPLLGGQVADVMLHAPYDLAFARRHDRVAIVAPYCRETFALAYVPEGGARFEGPLPGLAGRRVAVELAGLPDLFLSAQFGGVLRAQLVREPTGDAAVRAVLAGRADAVIATRAQIEHAGLAQGLRLRQAPLPGLLARGWDVGLAVRDDSRDLGDALEEAVRELAQDGRLDRMFAGYGVARQPPALA
ncbi:MAG: transporter substrate-binding domain-containing protein [Sphingomonadaceae bacterium]|uniref:substrate-binding periplasmic protein n=1 Tax=Thermaurantiacus sp. TaxID=2820283 RepID=UPI00298F2A58|nr:transporter substrate-binding domain-containing protein [Thermaurantiacus sp.]MCS6986245.1 transporter substrate-binding domain-containing protein [Sphingomonadaceae bacterium]MDW8415692.1 transporter substrate-binding domain-containing protein [Thermaurantiacus sp.]